MDVNDERTDSSRAVSRQARFKDLQEHNSGQWDWPFPLREFIWVFGVAGDEAISFVGVQGAALLGVVQGQRLFTFKGCEPSAPLRDGRIAADPDFGWLRIEFVSEAKSQDFVALIKKVVDVVISLRVGVVSAEQLRKRVVTTQFWIRHGGILA